MCIRDRSRALTEGSVWGSQWTLVSGATFFSVVTNTAREYRVRQVDGGGNVSTESSGLIVTHDDTAPTITAFNADDVTLGLNGTTTINAIFAEAVYGFNDGDISLTGNGTTSAFSGAGGDSSYSLLYTAPNIGTGTASFSLAGVMVTDTAGNQNILTDTLSLTYDDTVPTASVTIGDSTLKIGQQTTVTIDWGETINDSNFDIADLSVNVGTLGETLTETVTDRKYCLLYTSPSPRDRTRSRMPSSA